MWKHKSNKIKPFLPNLLLVRVFHHSKSDPNQESHSIVTWATKPGLCHSTLELDRALVFQVGERTEVECIGSSWSEHSAGSICQIQTL